jgi:predicted Rossmann fold flavoprotein
MCALEAGRCGRRVLLIDHADRVGKKILISGGGRCNFTNLHTKPENFLSENTHFAKSALARYTPSDFLRMVEEHRIPFHEKTRGQLFCDRSAQEIVSMLERECAGAGVRKQLGTRILSVTRPAEAASSKTPFLVQTSQQSLRASSIVIATGGLSIPKMGATGFGYTLAEQFGLGIVPCRPALVPFTLTPEDLRAWSDLAGISAEAIVSIEDRRQGVDFREKVLFTHRGLSGPAILQISSFWRPGTSIRIDLAPSMAVTAPLLAKNAQRSRTNTIQALRSVFPSRLAERWFALHQPSDWTNASLAVFEARLHAWQLTPTGTEGFAKAEVTVGGIDTASLHPQTMQSRKVPGLYFIGEVVDVTGWLGGYNFQWAWASGFCAGQSA